MQQADVACYAAKRAGGNRISIYRPGVGEGHERHLELQAAADMRDAISEDRFSLFVQKIVATGEAQIPRYELLLRMISREGGLVSPAQFIPAAERFGPMGDKEGATPLWRAVARHSGCAALHQSFGQLAE
jgi:predicted signal transduction protein with EAL and GGDEF domain